ncbi:MAG: magnesium/cobalt transporter CorA [Dehalococcoidia bacterium]|nr:magnesium/cobalt transporter CorA [Dehalococcoidia bacterium]
MADGGRLTALYRSRDGAFGEIASGAELRQALADPDGLLWIDLIINSAEDARVLTDVFSFHPLTIEDCVSPHLDPAKIDDHGEYIFIVVQALAGYVPDEELEAFEVDFYLGSNYVVSCHQQPATAIEHFRERVRRDEGLLSHGADWLLHGLLDALVDEYLPIVDAVDDTIDQIEEKVLHRPETRLLEQVMMVKRNALRLRRATTPQRDIMNRLSRGEYPKLIREETAIYYRDVYDHLVRIEYLVEALRDLADGALQTYLSVVSNRLNQVMKVLTVAVVPLTVGTLISGIYGMNLTAGFWPPSDSEWGFGAVVAFMVVVAVLTLVYFRYRRWI